MNSKISIIILSDNNNDLNKISNNIYNTCSNKNISINLSINPDEILNKSEEEFVIMIDNNITFMKGFDEKIIETLSSSNKSIVTFPYLDEIKNKVYYPGGLTELA